MNNLEEIQSLDPVENCTEISEGLLRLFKAQKITVQAVRKVLKQFREHVATKEQEILEGVFTNIDVTKTDIVYHTEEQSVSVGEIVNTNVKFDHREYIKETWYQKWDRKMFGGELTERQGYQYYPKLFGHTIRFPDPKRFSSILHEIGHSYSKLEAYTLSKLTDMDWLYSVLKWKRRAMTKILLMRLKNEIKASRNGKVLLKQLDQIPQIQSTEYSKVYLSSMTYGYLTYAVDYYAMAFNKEDKDSLEPYLSVPSFDC